ncbi:helicase-related protein [Rhodovulum sp. PH10]|uniref:helicase-related protein n=1 Tax=Rhodovulum sp. PH10 TaxID=1187851 RepID=UPI001ED8D92E|nr:helicase-related protein [Rhodovulum sp. PH10]
MTAVLGPTNTGKTHLAIERMLGHSSGIIGLPLRLLAREVYNKVVDRVGPDQVALITGEEKIKPQNPRFWVSTVEAMPRDLDVAFVAVDEVQLGADFERGHVFTDRILNRRGREETLVLGAATVRPMIEKLLPGANVISRPRLSQLTFAGEKKLSRQPRRTAIVAFSAEEVYAIAELIRRQRGGAAVVLGALSPRTRNAQVALYQSGDVDYLVATDAIGMGLNLDVDHVAFGSERKFDGYQYRRLTPAEFGQIAGRAGRHSRDGTFGTTGRCTPFEPDLVHALESHSFEPIKVLQWRNTELDFSSLGALQASLATTPTLPGLTRAPVAEDILVLEHASRDDGVRELARGRAAIERLWETCQVPDYRKISPAAHAELVVTLFGFLAREGRIPTDWFSRQVALADHAEGGIDTLSTRIAHIRTWTFVANRPDWLSDPEHWQGVTRAIEDKLSDALHERLAERFIDRRTSVLMRRLRENAMLDTEITKTGEVVVEGHVIGRLDGFRFAPEATTGGTDTKAVSAVAQKALAGEIDARASRLAHAPDSQFVLASGGLVRWMGEPVAKLLAGDNILRPRVKILADEHLAGAAAEHVQTRLDLWTRTHVERVLAPLFVLGAADEISGIARGIAFQLVEALGVLERFKIAEELKSLDQAQRAMLRKYGVRFGAYHVYVPALLKPAPRALAAELWALKHGDVDTSGLDDLQRLAASGRTSFPVDKAVSRMLYRTIGYRVCGERAVRVDILERLADLIRPALSWRPNAPGEKPAGAFDGSGFTVTQAMTSLTGSSGEDLASILKALGYRMERRPKPPEALVPEVSASEASDSETAEATTEVVTAAAAPAESGGEAAETTAVETTTAETAAEIAAEPAEVSPTAEVSEALVPEALVPETRVSEAPVPEAPVLEAPVPDQTSAEEAPSVAEATEVPAEQPSAEEQPAGEDVAGQEVAGQQVAGEEVAAEQAAAEAAPEASSDESAAAEAEKAPEEPQFIEIWRPGRPHDDRRGQKRHHRPGKRPGAGPAAAATAPGEAGQPAAAAPAEGSEARGRPEGERDRNRDRGERNDNRGERGDRERGEKFGRGRPRGDRPDRPERGRSEGGGRRERFDRDRDRDRPPRTYQSRDERSSRSDKEPDPNSPFAKLLALKAQLEADAKERH